MNEGTGAVVVPNPVNMSAVVVYAVVLWTAGSAAGRTGATDGFVPASRRRLSPHRRLSESCRSAAVPLSPSSAVLLELNLLASSWTRTDAEPGQESGGEGCSVADTSCWPQDTCMSVTVTVTVTVTHKDHSSTIGLVHLCGLQT